MFTVYVGQVERYTSSRVEVFSGDASFVTESLGTERLPHCWSLKGTPNPLSHL